MKVHQFLTSFAYGDAIGNEAVEIRKFLRLNGIESEIFALYYHPRYSNEIYNYLEYDRFSSRENIVIFHFSIGSPVSKKFIRLVDKKVIIYHNITPYEFFLDYHRVLAKDCFKGRVELKSFLPYVDLALGDSEYNRLELEEAGFKKTGVLPLMMNFEKFNRQPLPSMKRLFADGKRNLLFVGRIIPNKKVEDVIKTFYFYKHYFNPDSRLLIAGEYRGFERYLFSLQKLINDLKLKDVHFFGHLTDEELVSLFKLAHLYLHLSEHEGFCAPIIEAFIQKIPVIAYAAAAVPETMAGGGFLVYKKDYIKIATLIDEILNDPQLYQQIASTEEEIARKLYNTNRCGEILIQNLNSISQCPINLTTG